MDVCGNCGEELEAGFTFCPACACVVSKKTALPPPQVEDEPPEQQAPLYAALNSLHGSIGLDKDQLAGLSAARNEEINHSRQRRAPEHKTRQPTKKQSWREPPLQHPTVWRPMGKVRPPPAKLRVSATEPAMASRPDEGRLPRGGSTKRGGGIKGRASRSQLSGADSSFGEAAEQPAGQDEQEDPAELSFRAADRARHGRLPSRQRCVCPPRLRLYKWEKRRASGITRWPPMQRRCPSYRVN